MINRRTFVGATVAVGGAAAAMPLLAGCADDETAGPSHTAQVSLRINGEQRDIEVDNRTSLLDMLRR